MGWSRVSDTSQVVKPGDEITVKIIAVDPMGKIKLSRKQALSKEELEAEMALAPAGTGEEERDDRRGPVRIDDPPLPAEAGENLRTDCIADTLAKLKTGMLQHCRGCHNETILLGDCADGAHRRTA